MRIQEIEKSTLDSSGALQYPENIQVFLLSDVRWKFHENLFTCFPVMLLTDTDLLET